MRVLKKMDKFTKTLDNGQSQKTNRDWIPLIPNTKITNYSNFAILLILEYMHTLCWLSSENPISETFDSLTLTKLKMLRWSRFKKFNLYKNIKKLVTFVFFFKKFMTLSYQLLLNLNQINYFNGLGNSGFQIKDWKINSPHSYHYVLE